MGFFGELWDSFTGDAQRQDLAEANEQARAARAKGKKKAIERSETGLDQSLSYVTPTMESGRRGSRLYEIALGAGSEDRDEAKALQKRYFDDFQDDPGYQAVVTRAIDNADRSATARGELYGGEYRDALATELGLLENQMFQQRLSRLADLKGSGDAAAGTAANYTFNTGRYLSDLEYGHGQQDANQYIDYGNAMAQSRSIPINNLFEAIKAGANIAKASYGVPSGTGG